MSAGRGRSCANDTLDSERTHKRRERVDGIVDCLGPSGKSAGNPVVWSPVDVGSKMKGLRRYLDSIVRKAGSQECNEKRKRAAGSAAKGFVKEAGWSGVLLSWLAKAFRPLLTTRDHPHRAEN